MAFKIKKAVLKELDTLTTAYEDKKGEFEVAVETFNMAVNEAFEKLKKSKTELNATITEIREKIEEITTGFRDEFSEKTAKWQESEAGNGVNNWIEAWEQHGELYADVEVEQPDDVEPEFPDVGEPPDETP